MHMIEKLNSEQLKSDIPTFAPGDTVRVHQIIQEGNKERIQVFEGVVLRRNGGGIAETFTVRKVSYNVGVERIFPIHSPRVSKIEVKQRGRVRRARLYYLRERSGKAARIQQARFSPEQFAKEQEEAARLLAEEIAEKEAQEAAKAAAAGEEAGAESSTGEASK